MKEQRRVVLQELEQTSQQLGQENSCRHAHFVGSTDWQFAWPGAAGTYGFAAAKGAMDGTTPPENWGIGEGVAGVGWAADAIFWELVSELVSFAGSSPREVLQGQFLVGQLAVALEATWSFIQLVCLVAWCDIRHRMIGHLASLCMVMDVVKPIGNHTKRLPAKVLAPKAASMTEGRERSVWTDCNSSSQCFSRRDSGSFASYHRAFEDSGSAVPICSSVSADSTHVFWIFSVLCHHATGIKKCSTD